MKKIGLLSLATALVFVACKKDKSSSDSAEQNEALALSAASSNSESLYDDAFDLVLQDGESNNVAGREYYSARVSSCAVVTLTPADLNTYPKTMSLDFGSGCTSSNGVTRKGKITATMSGRIRTAGTTISLSFENFYINGYKLEGTYTITNNGGTGLNFTTQVTNGKVTYPDATTWYSYSGTHTLAQTAGSSTVTFADDNFSVTGNNTAASSAGKSLTVNIITPLVKNAGCLNISSGVEQFKYGVISGSLDFGNGTCDNQALLTVGPSSQTITLPR